jgi:excisionase family DNA binding protein
MKLTPKQAAARHGLSVSLIYQLCSERRLRHFRCGGKGRRGKILIEEEDITAFLLSCEVIGSETADEDLKYLH